MTFPVSRCLDTFSRLPSMAERRKAYTQLPDTCPHSDCSPGATCKAVCGDWAAMQKKIKEAKR